MARSTSVPTPMGSGRTTCWRCRSARTGWSGLLENAVSDPDHSHEVRLKLLEGRGRVTVLSLKPGGRDEGIETNPCAWCGVGRLPRCGRGVRRLLAGRRRDYWSIPDCVDGRSRCVSPG